MQGGAIRLPDGIYHEGKRNSMKSRKMPCLPSAVAALLLLGVPSLSAQSAGTGALTGTVTDPAGALVPNVTVTLTNNDTGQVRALTTGGDGTYRFALIPPGSYKVKFSAAGFKVEEVPSVILCKRVRNTGPEPKLADRAAGGVRNR